MVAIIDKILGAKSDPAKIKENMRDIYAMINHGPTTEIDAPVGGPNRTSPSKSACLPINPAEQMRSAFGKALLIMDGRRKGSGKELVKPFHHLAGKNLKMKYCYSRLACIISNADSFTTFNYRVKDPVTSIVTSTKYAQLSDFVYEVEVKGRSMMMDFDMFLAELGLDKMINLIELEAMKERSIKDFKRLKVI